MCKLSVIIPVHNTEAVLKRCIDSILGQDFADIELLLVDDGSTDDCGKICEEYVEKDKRVRVFHKPFGGASSARNVGLNHAKGEWVSFVDSDDYLDKGYFDLPYDEKVGLYVRNMRYPNDESETRFMSQMFDGEEYLSILQKVLHQFSFRSACCCVVQTSIINAHSIRFDERFRLGEDTLFMLDYYSYCKSLQTIGGACYRYDRAKHWEDKYILTWKEVELYLSVFMDKYDALPIIAPQLPALLFGLFRAQLSKDVKYAHKKWLHSDPVKRFVETQIPARGRLFRLQYLMKELVRYRDCDICRVFKNGKADMLQKSLMDVV